MAGRHAVCNRHADPYKQSLVGIRHTHKHIRSVRMRQRVVELLQAFRCNVSAIAFAVGHPAYMGITDNQKCILGIVQSLM